MLTCNSLFSSLSWDMNKLCQENKWISFECSYLRLNAQNCGLHAYIAITIIFKHVPIFWRNYCTKLTRVTQFFNENSKIKSFSVKCTKMWLLLDYKIKQMLSMLSMRNWLCSHILVQLSIIIQRFPHSEELNSQLSVLCISGEQFSVHN